MTFLYALTPFAAWVSAGSIKFLINSVTAGRPAFNLIGYGGLPSNHSAIVSSITALIALREGISHPSFGVSLTYAFIVILDASSLRRQVGRHAQHINRLFSEDESNGKLRERIGHTPVEIAAGVLLGILVAVALNMMAG